MSNKMRERHATNVNISFILEVPYSTFIILSYLILSYQILSYQILSYPILSYLILPYLFLTLPGHLKLSSMLFNKSIVARQQLRITKKNWQVLHLLIELQQSLKPDEEAWMKTGLFRFYTEMSSILVVPLPFRQHKF